MKTIKNILIAVFALIVLYWIMFVLTPSSKLAEETYKKIDSLNHNIDSVEALNRSLDSQLVNYNSQIEKQGKKIEVLETKLDGLSDQLRKSDSALSSAVSKINVLQELGKIK